MPEDKKPLELFASAQDRELAALFHYEDHELIREHGVTASGEPVIWLRVPHDEPKKDA